MSGIRRALLFTSAERYINLTVNFLLVAIVSRLLTPAEVGVSAFGAVALVLVETLRDLPSSYLVQQKELSREDIRTSFTVMMGISLLLAGGIVLGADAIAALYGDPGLASYLYVFALALLPGPFERPVMALFRREMAFARYAFVNVSIVLVNAAITIALVLAGFGYHAFAWAALCAALTSAALALWFRPDVWIFRPYLGSWREAVRCGGYASLYALLNQLGEMLPYLVLSRVYKFEGVGYYNRALLVSQTPGKVLLSGLSPVVFPALAAEVRRGGDLKAPFLLGVAYITAVYWPAFTLLALLAHPAVEIIVGPQWLSIVPLVRIIALAMLWTFSGILIYPTLMALGAMRDLLLSSAIAVPIGGLITAIAAAHGLTALALSLILANAVQAGVGLAFARRHLRFGWAELWAAMARSVVVTAFAAAPPALAILSGAVPFDMPVRHGIALGLAALAGWVAGLWVARHPLRREMTLILGGLRARMRRATVPVPGA